MSDFSLSIAKASDSNILSFADNEGRTFLVLDKNGDLFIKSRSPFPDVDTLMPVDGRAAFDELKLWASGISDSDLPTIPERDEPMLACHTNDGETVLKFNLNGDVEWKGQKVGSDVRVIRAVASIFTPRNAQQV